MKSHDLKAIEGQRQALLDQLNAAASAMREGLKVQGFGNTHREHLDRALSHLAEATIAIHEPRHARSVHQLVDDLNRIQQVADNAQRPRRKSIRI